MCDNETTHPVYLEKDDKLEWYKQLCLVVRDSEAAVDTVVIGQELGLNDDEIGDIHAEILGDEEG